MSNQTTSNTQRTGQTHCRTWYLSLSVFVYDYPLQWTLKPFELNRFPVNAIDLKLFGLAVYDMQENFNLCAVIVGH